MDLSKYNMEEIILSAIRSEMNANGIYTGIAAKVKNSVLKDKMEFLAKEEEKHRDFLEELFRRKFPEKTLDVPQDTPVPLPAIKLYNEEVKLSEVLESAMEAERAAKDFYNELANQFGKEPETKKTLQYLASMEWGHYKLLEIERENSLNFEQYDEYWPMMHVGG